MCKIRTGAMQKRKNMLNSLTAVIHKNKCGAVGNSKKVVHPWHRDIPAAMFRQCEQMPQERFRVIFATSEGERPGDRRRTGPGGVNIFSTWLSHFLVWRQQIYHSLLKTLRYFETSEGWWSCDPLEKKAGVKAKRWTSFQNRTILV